MASAVFIPRPFVKSMLDFIKRHAPQIFQYAQVHVIEQADHAVPGIADITELEVTVPGVVSQFFSKLDSRHVIVVLIMETNQMKSTTCDAMLRYGHLPRVRATFGAWGEAIVFQQGLNGGAR